MEKNNKNNSEEKKHSQKDSKDSVETVTTRKKKSREERVIRLLGNRSVYHVLVVDFINVSQLAKQQDTAGNLMNSVDLSKFSDQSILAFVNYIQTREVRSSLTYYAITELLTLSKSFQMRELKLCLEEAIVEASKVSEADLLQTLIICDVVQISPETERILQISAVEAIEKIVALPDFHKIPFNQIYQILSACELSTVHEMFVADVVIFWLSGQSHVNIYAPAMFSCIRTKFLSPVDKTMILERVHLLNMPEKLIRLARNILESSNSQRSCVEASHVKKNYSRCNPNPCVQSVGIHTSLPLSRPSFTLKMKKSKEVTSKMKPKFDPSTAPKIIDLIQSAPKASSKASAKSIKKTDVIKSKSKCACVEYLKNKFSEKKSTRSKGPAVLKYSEKDKIKSKSEKMAQKMKDVARSDRSIRSTKSQSSVKRSSRSDSEKRTEQRRNEKRKKIDAAIKGSKKNEKSQNSTSIRKGVSKSTSSF